MKITIKNKLLLSFVALILVSLSIQLIFSYFFADKLYTVYKKQYMETGFYEIKEAYDGSIESIEELISDMEETHSIQLIIGNDDTVMYATYMGTMEFSDIGFDEEVERERENGEERNGERPTDMMSMANQAGIEQEGYVAAPKANQTMMPENSEEILSLAGNFDYDGVTIYVNMTLPVASLQNSASFFTNANAVIAFFVLIFAIFVASRFAKSITKPIMKVEKISSNLANLIFDEYVSEDNATREVDSLARSINQMSKELKSKIDDLNLANEKLQQDVEYQMQIEQMRREFIANVSHEMKTPLAILQFYCENLKSDIEGIDKTYYYDTIIEETNRMNDMVKSMLDISSLENGLSKMHMEEIDFSKVVEHTVTKLEPLLAKFKLVVEIEKNIMIQGDAQYLEQAIKNYITNAVSHTAEEKEIRVRLIKEESFAKITVYNEGESIKESHIERIWESFYKSDQARVREANTNVGLGLYIVKCIVENHSGFYGVQNRDNGVEFEFKIPFI